MSAVSKVSNIASSLSYAQMYVSKCKFALTPLRPFAAGQTKSNSKAPSEKAWQSPKNWVTTEAQCVTYFSPKGKGFTKQPVGEPGIGLIHEGSGTMALDVDNYDATKALFANLGVDLDAVLGSTAQITRGDPTRAKAIFRLPATGGLGSVRKLVVQHKGKVAVEFRGGHGHQDALPPTTHPSGVPFSWVGFDGTRECFAVLPDALWDLWQNPEKLTQGDYSATAQNASKAAPTDWKPSFHDELVLKYVGPVADMLNEAGYTQHTDGRFSKPGSDAAGMVVYPDGRAWSFHGSEPLYFGKAPHPLGPFDVFCGLMALDKGQTFTDTVREACQALTDMGGSGGTPPDNTAPVIVQEPGDDEERGPLWLPPSAVYGDDPVDWPDLPTTNPWQGIPAIDPSPSNCDKILRQHSALADVFRYDEFTGSIYVVNPPWRTDSKVSAYHRENTPTGLAVFLGNDNPLYRRLSHQLLARAITVRAMEERRLDSLRNQIDLLPEWDTRTRIDTWLIDYCGAEDTPANRYIGRKFLLGMVARAIKPGCKMDNMMIMEGREGRGKSTLFDVLAGRLRFSERMVHRLCTEQHLTLRGDDTKASEKMQGAWIAELPELSSFSKADRLLLVSFISRKEDAYRTPYDIGVTSKPRRIVLVGTTNETGDYLENAEGNRRFWPVTVEKVRTDEIALDREQLLAEALAALRAEEPWWMEEHEEVRLGLKALQKSRTSDNPLDSSGKQALISLCKGLLQTGRQDKDLLHGKGNALAEKGLFFTSSDVAQIAGSFGPPVHPVSVGRWIQRFDGWAKCSKKSPPYDGSSVRTAYAPTPEWLDTYVPGWRDTKLGKEVEL